MSKRPANGDPITLISWPRGSNTQVWIRWADVDSMMIEMSKGNDGTTYLLDFGTNAEGGSWVLGHGISSADLRAALTAQALSEDW
jgi:hypothetical protein